MRRLVPILLTFTAALAAFVLLRGPEPAPSFGPPAPAAPRAAAAADAEIARLQSAARAAPRDVAPRVALASAYLQKARETGDPGFYSRADELLRAALARRPGDPDALVASAGLALSRHDFRGGLRLARRARAARPGALAPYPALVDALVELARGRPAAARASQRAALAAVPGYPAAEAGLARLDAARGDLGGAIRRWRRLDDLRPAPEHALALGEALLAAGRETAARRVLATVG